MNRDELARDILLAVLRSDVTGRTDNLAVSKIARGAVNMADALLRELFVTRPVAYPPRPVPDLEGGE